jgi:uncharacterized cupin superfamily protein
MEISIKKLSEAEIREMRIRDWPIWEKEASKFDWYYDSEEMCLILEGSVTVSHSSGSSEIKAGDFVTFPRGMECVWEIHEDIRKHYKFV